MLANEQFHFPIMLLTHNVAKTSIVHRCMNLVIKGKFGECKSMKMKNGFHDISQFWMFDTGKQIR